MQKLANQRVSESIQLIKASKRLLNVQSSLQSNLPLKVTVKNRIIHIDTISFLVWPLFLLVDNFFVFAYNQINLFHHHRLVHLRSTLKSSFHQNCDQFSSTSWQLHMIGRDGLLNVSDYRPTDDLNIFSFCLTSYIFHKWTRENKGQTRQERGKMEQRKAEKIEFQCLLKRNKELE